MAELKFRSGKFAGHVIDEIRKSHPWYIEWVNENRPEMLRVKILPPTKKEAKQLKVDRDKIVKEHRELFFIEGVLDLIEVEEEFFKITVFADTAKAYRDGLYTTISSINDFQDLNKSNKECVAFLPIVNKAWLDELILGEIIVLKGCRKDDAMPIITDIGKFIGYYEDEKLNKTSAYRSLLSNSTFEFQLLTKSFL